MALVDYPSSSSDSEPPSPPPPKRRIPSPSSPSPPAPPAQPRQQQQPTPTTTTALPPLPPTFHDLYAHTVRQSPVDDPTLHQGRRRTIPHVPGNWPSHLYIEWIPSSAQHSLLSSFLSQLQAALPENHVGGLNGFLTSDLGAPLPLHVSLSRPISLSTAEKDRFLEGLVDRVGRTGLRRFRLGCRGGVEGHRTAESGRSFLVLRVRSGEGTDRGKRRGGGGREEGREEEEDDPPNHNPELTVLLARCNTAVESYGQPKLYEWADEARIGDAFHVSIAWSFAEPDEEVRRRTAEVFERVEFRDAIAEMEFEVDGVKAKIGNVVHHIPLARGTKRPRGLFGI